MPSNATRAQCSAMQAMLALGSFVQGTLPFAIAAGVMAPPSHNHPAGVGKGLGNAIVPGIGMIAIVAKFAKQIFDSGVKTMDGASLTTAADNMKAAADGITDIATAFIPKIKVEMVLTTSINIDFQYRSCRPNTEEYNDRRKKNAKLTEENCNVLVLPLKQSADMHFISQNRFEWSIPALMPAGALNIQPVIGVEFDFDITPLFNALGNGRRRIFNERRIKLCKQCSGKGFCDSMNSLANWTPKQDECWGGNKDSCENQVGLTTRAGMKADRPTYITNLNQCDAIRYVRVNEDQPMRETIGTKGKKASGKRRKF